MLFLLDIHQNALFAYAVLQCNADCFKDANIVLKANCISIEFSRNATPCKFNVKTPEDFVSQRAVALCTNNIVGCIAIYEENVTKLSLSVLSPDAELNADESPVPLEFIFQFYIQSIDVIEKCIVRRFDSPMYFIDVMYDKYKSIDACKVICTNCGMFLSEKSIKFESVQKYYDWKSELGETSFCHKHDDHDASEIKANSLYIDNMYFYFHHSILPHFKLLEENKSYKCTNCSSTLSFQKKMDNLQCIGFFGDKVMFSKSPDKEDYEKHKVNACLLSFYSIIEESLKTEVSPKLYLQSKVGEKTDVLLLWLDEEKVVQFVLEELDENKTQEDVELKAKEAFSALYCSTSSDSDLSREWKHDFNVEFFQISDNMMNVVKGLFEERPDYFSEWKDANQGFSYGYFPVEVPIS